MKEDTGGMAQIQTTRLLRAVLLALTRGASGTVLAQQTSSVSGHAIAYEARRQTTYAHGLWSRFRGERAQRDCRADTGGSVTCARDGTDDSSDRKNHHGKAADAPHV